ncbi:hypothetical protein PDIG_62110 [Penicillium digitatum PHI26]|uniref:C2H2 finger domain protein n=2 Tax=Penicillium digitatum TaxID=36651 RepID=K9FMC1_PEND2|nr:hypothetical protein PDIP_71500 [Penicillium digitatum Pd1]EKV07870.1 hypothetical protein PDIP_71500 [Penicillium digitatum Pd1]EKV09457.1 hypothetical protein PDIG_62110 [Penicillium digitatum PHI26]
MSRPLPNPSQRHHTHSTSLGALNPNHRVTRRKSITAAAANAAAAVVASMEGGEATSLPMGAHRRSLAGRKGLETGSIGNVSGFSSYLSRRINSPSQEPPVARKSSPGSDHSDGKPKNRNRGASEGAQLKTEGKRASTAIRCDRCGKGWEHDPAWSVTSKLLISKHQQVQLLEAASVLVTMNHDDPPDESAELESELSSGSPDALSEMRDGISSVETTPPPMDSEEDDDFEMSGVPAQWTKRPSVSNASGFSRSYQSIPSSSYNDSAPLHSPSFSHFRQSSIDTRPSTADARLHEDDEADLAAAIGLCNFGTPRTGPVSMTPDVPPVPPLPARYLDSSSHPSTQGLHSPYSRPTEEAACQDSYASIFLSRSLNPSLSYKVSDEREVRTGGDEAQKSRQRRNADVDFGNRSAPADDDDGGVFGHMEE